MLPELIFIPDCHEVEPESERKSRHDVIYRERVAFPRGFALNHLCEMLTMFGCQKRGDGCAEVPISSKAPSQRFGDGVPNANFGGLQRKIELFTESCIPYVATERLMRTRVVFHEAL